MNPTDLKYSKEHEWIQTVSDSEVVIGITTFATESLGDVVYLDLPEVGTDIEQFSKIGEIESVKAVSDLYTPIGGKVVERNEDAIENPEKVNDDPYGDGWLIKVSVRDKSELDKLLSAQEYESFTTEQS